MRDNRVKLRKAERKASFWVKQAKIEPEGGRGRKSARKAKKGLSRARRLLDQQVIDEEVKDK